MAWLAQTIRARPDRRTLSRGECGIVRCATLAPLASACRFGPNGVTLCPDGLQYFGPRGEVVAKWLIDQVHLPVH
jgi:hypothetical protein